MNSSLLGSSSVAHYSSTSPITKNSNTSDDSETLPTKMFVKKRNGTMQAVDITKITKAIGQCCAGLKDVDAAKVAQKTILGIYDGATTKQLDELSIQTAADLIGDEPEYSFLAGRLLANYISKEVEQQGITSFSDSVLIGHNLGIIRQELVDFMCLHKTTLDNVIDDSKSNLFQYFGLKTVYDRYLLKHPITREVIETSQQFLMRVSASLADNLEEALELYGLFSSLEYLTSSPTLFNAGTVHQQLSSCYLLDSPEDSLSGIYDRYKDIAKLSKFSGGIGVAISRIRSRGSHIKSTNGKSNGVVPWLKTLDSSVAAVNQGGRRKGACCVYLETWHADILEFLELRDNTGNEAQRTYNLNLANWIPDLFMKRMANDEMWSLFDPSKVPSFPDLYGEDFEAAYLKAEKEELYEEQISARVLFEKMLKTLGHTGNGWMTFKDRSNITSNQTGCNGNVIHLSNLCTEILEVTSQDEGAVCNLGSLNLGRCVVDGKFDFDKLRSNARIAVRQLDSVIDRNFYPLEMSERSNSKWRPIGLGYMGLQDVFFKLKLPFDSKEALALTARIAEEIAYTAYRTSCDLAKKNAPHPSFLETKAAKGILHIDHWETELFDAARWEKLRRDIKEHGLRNSLMIAIAPTATIASITGCYECIEPQISNLFKRETLSGEFLQVNDYLVKELKSLGLWNDSIKAQIKMANGSIQDIKEIPEDIKLLYRTSWELKMKPLINLAVARAPFIDQSQSLNLFMESPDINRLSAMYYYAWKMGLKTTYYLRSRPATEIGKTFSLEGLKQPQNEESNLDLEAVMCSLENPGNCPACE